MRRVVLAGAAGVGCALALIGVALGCGDTHTGGPERESGGSGSGAGKPAQPQAGRPAGTKPGPAQGGADAPQPGNNPPDPPGQSVYFNPRLDGDKLVLDVKQVGIDGLYYLTCTQRFMLEKLVNDEFVPVRDDRPVPNVRPGYFLDGEFIPGGVDGGCSVKQCVRFPDERIEVGPAYEYVQLGVMPAPGADASIPPVPVLERRPLTGLIRITLTYFQDAMCQLLSGITLEHALPGPDEGVCCPIGPARCSSEGPGGGWAPSLDECAPFETERDARYVIENDPRGCPKLVQTYEGGCCSCVDEDAGA